MENFEKFCEEIEKIRGAAVYGDIDDEPYVELAMITDENIAKATEIIKKYGYKITNENECEGSDYPSYCIWFESVSHTPISEEIIKCPLCDEIITEVHGYIGENEIYQCDFCDILFDSDYAEYSEDELDGDEDWG